jgi:aryl-alcohol dehydrogenase-like predicted oxidoreductase
MARDNRSMGSKIGHFIQAVNESHEPRRPNRATFGKLPINVELMHTRSLGRSGIQVAPLALGGNVFGWTLNENRSFSVLDAFVDKGYNLIDTADVYSRWVPANQGGESERIIGKWIKSRGNRDKVIIATKVGKEMGVQKKGLSARYILQAVEDSLKRLQTDYIDLYQSHEDDPNTPMAETMGAFASLVKAGKVRVLGASNFTGARLRESLQVCEGLGFPRYETLQPLYNLYDRSDFEQQLGPLCRQEQLGVLPYYSLASGFLTGKYRTERDLAKSPRGKGNKKYLNPRGFAILEALDQVAARYHCGPATIAIAWLLSRPTVSAPIASATSAEQLEAIVQAASLELDKESIDVLDQASS